MKILLSVMLVALLVVSLFAGCKAQDTAAVTSAAEEPAAAAEATDAAVADEPVTITWMDYNGYALDEMDAVFDELAAEGIIVKAEHVANDYTTVLNTKINSGDIPDIFITEAGPLNEVYAEYTYDLSNEPIKDLFADWALKSTMVGDELIGLPVNVETFSLIYNKDLFKQAGITELPKTQSELLAVCKQLEANGITPFSDGYKEWWVVFQHQVSAFMMAGGDTPEALAEKLTSGELSFADMPYMSNYLDFIDMSVEHGLPKPLETDWETEEVNVATGKAAIMHMGQWCEPTLVGANPDVNVAFLPMPVSEDPSMASVSSNVSWVVRVSDTCQNKEAALRVIEYFLTSQSGLNYTVGLSGWTLALKETPMESQGMLTASANDIIAQSTPYAWANTAWPSGFSEGAGQIIQSYIAGTKTRDQVFSDLDALWAELSAS